MPSKSNEKGPPKRPMSRAPIVGRPPKSTLRIAGHLGRWAGGSGMTEAIGPSLSSSAGSGQPISSRSLRIASRRRALRRLRPQSAQRPDLGLPALEMDIAALGPHAGLEHQREAGREDEDAARAREGRRPGLTAIISRTPRTKIVHSTTGWSMKVRHCSRFHMAAMWAADRRARQGRLPVVSDAV